MPAIDELETAARSVIKIETETGRGSGNVIAHVGNNSYVLTCKHVIDDEPGMRVQVVRREGKRFVSTPGIVERCDPKHDLAIVRTSRRIPVPAIGLADKEPELYEPLYSVGCGSGFYGLAARALLTALDGSAGEAGATGYLYTGLCINGMSGGALIDEDGALVGVIEAMDRNGHLPVWSIGHAVPLPAIKAFLRNPSKFAKGKKSA